MAYEISFKFPNNSRNKILPHEFKALMQCSIQALKNGEERSHILICLAQNTSRCPATPCHVEKGEPFQRTRAPTSVKNNTVLAQEIILKYGKERVTGIASVPNCEILAVSTASERVYIYEYSTRGEPIRFFDGHKEKICKVVHLSDDILASVDRSGMLLTWRATTGVVLEQLKVSNHGCRRMSKVSAAELLFGTEKGERIIVRHDNGRDLAIHKRFKDEQNVVIRSVRAYNDKMVIRGESNVEIRNYSDGELLHTIHNIDARSIALHEDFIVIGDYGNMINVYEIRDGYNLLRTFDLRRIHPLTRDCYGITDINFLNGDIAIVTTTRSGILFFSPVSGQCFSHCQLDMSKISTRATILSDGRICVGGMGGYCAIINSPPEIELFVNAYIDRMHTHPFLALIPFFSHPLEVAFDGIQGKTLPIANALELATNSRYNSKSIQEWAYAHQIVMAAVRADFVPRDRKYKNEEVYWWDKLYDKASSLEMGMGDMNLVLKFIKEAEVAGILATGCSELFKKAHGLKKELKMDINSLQTTIVDLYCRQIALNDKVEDILRSQMIQRRVAVVNAILACIPLAGGVAGQVLSGGMAIMANVGGEDLSLSSLVESLLGIGKDWSSFVTEPAVKRFLRAGNKVLEEETWDGVPEANQLAVEAAAEGLGLSINELRAKLKSTVLEESSEAIDEIPDDGDGDVGTVEVEVAFASLGQRDEEITASREFGPPSATSGGGDSIICLSMMEIWEKMEKRAREQDEKIEKMGKQAKSQEEKIEKMASQIEILKDLILWNEKK